MRKSKLTRRHRPPESAAPSRGRRELLAAALAVLAMILPVALAAQVAEEPAGSRVYHLLGIEIADAPWGQEVRLRSDGSLERVGVQLFQGLGVVIQLPAHLPGPGVGGLAPADGLVSAVELDLDEGAEGPITRVVVRTRQPVSQSVASESGLLRVRLSASGPPPVDAPAASTPPTAVTGRDAVEVATLQGALERSNRARADLAARIENLNAEAETLRERVRALEANRLVLETDLESTRAQAAELGRDLDQRGQELERLGESSAEREAALRAQIDALEASRGDLERLNQELGIRVEAAALERRDLTRELDAGAAELAAVRERLAAMEGQQAEQSAALDSAGEERARLEAELARLRAEADRHYQRARARTDAAALEQRVGELERQLAAAQAEGERLARAADESARQLAESRTGGEQALGRLGETTAELEAVRGRENELTRRVSELEGELAALRGLSANQATSLDAGVRDRESLESRLAAASGERDRLSGELAAVRAELDRERQQGFDRELEVAREVEYRVAELRRELEQARARLAEAEAESARLRSVAEQAVEMAAAPPAAPAPAAAPEPAGVEPASEPAQTLAVAPVAAQPGLDERPPPRAEGARAWTTSATRLRRQPSTDSEILAALPPATEVEAAPEAGEPWTAAVLEREGWLLGTFLEPTGDGEAVTNDRVNLRTAPGLDSTVLGSLPVGTRVTPIEESAGWVRARVEQRGWIYGSLLSASPPAPPVAEAADAAGSPTGRITTDANLRAGPGIDEGVVAFLSEGTTAVVLASSGGWYRVRAAGHEGWVYRTLLRLEPAAGDPSSP